MYSYNDYNNFASLQVFNQASALTGPLDCIAGRKVLVLADAQNIDISAEKMGYKISWRNLGELFGRVSCSSSKHVFLSEKEGDTRRSAYLSRRGWTPHSKTFREIIKASGRKTDCNIDNFLVFWAGILCSRTTKDTDIVIASGDGGMILDIAESIRHLPIKRRIITVSLPNSTSARLNASLTDLIYANVEIGADVMRSL